MLAPFIYPHTFYVVKESSMIKSKWNYQTVSIKNQCLCQKTVWSQFINLLCSKHGKKSLLMKIKLKLFKDILF